MGEESGDESSEDSASGSIDESELWQRFVSTYTRVGVSSDDASNSSSDTELDSFAINRMASGECEDLLPSGVETGMEALKQDFEKILGRSRGGEKYVSRPVDFKKGGSRFRSWTRQIGNITKPYDKPCKSKSGPMGWRPSSCPELVVVDLDGVTCRYVQRGHGTGERKNMFYGRVVSSKPVAMDDFIYYFELGVSCNAGAPCGVSVGFSLEDRVDPKHDSSTSLGSSKLSVAYCGANGSIWARGKKIGGSHSMSFGDGDCVGCGINRVLRQVFFTKNGKLVYTTDTTWEGLRIFASAQLHNHGDVIAARFFPPGFQFDVEATVRQMIDDRETEIKSYKSKRELAPAMVREYLEFHGYEKTLDAFSSESDPTTNLADENSRALSSVFSEKYITSNKVGTSWLDNPPQFASLSKRASLRRMIMKGEPLIALETMRKWFPKCVLEFLENVGVVEQLNSQAFVELIRERKIEAAILFARTNLKKNTSANDLVALIAYEDPVASPYRHLMSEEQKELVADSVNRAIISYPRKQGFTRIKDSDEESCYQDGDGKLGDENDFRNATTALENVITQLTVTNILLGRYHTLS
uniref:B30.2/SPRY domain-containing protein n=1 Tax=Mucochytrium quahogii TaxID=96639 RepID=A0A7S2WEF0_9STRA